jgi:hypothetical protein
MSEEFTIEMFREHINSKFRMHHDAPDGSDIELIRVTDLSPNIRLIQFSIEFLAPLDTPVGQKTYRLTHPHLGELDLFLVPIAKDDLGLHYEAVFNRERAEGA